MKLLPPEDLVVTGPIDYANWNFRPLLGSIQRLRFGLILSLLGAEGCERLLEIGYGSGVFLPELARHARALYGIDIHTRGGQVERALQANGVSARLLTASAEALPFRDASFDRLVAVSSLEFVPTIDRAAQEMRRILRPGGDLVLVTPGQSLLVDLGLKLLTGTSARRGFGRGREILIPALSSCFRITAKRTAPRVGSSLVCLYSALRMTPR